MGQPLEQLVSAVLHGIRQRVVVEMISTRTSLYFPVGHSLDLQGCS